MDELRLSGLYATANAFFHSLEGRGSEEIVTVLDTKSQNIPEVVVVRRGAGGVLGS